MPVLLIVCAVALYLLPFIALEPLRRRQPAADEAPPVRGRPLSLIIPARNESATIATVLGTVRQSSYAPLEVIVVDDRSTDDTYDRAVAAAAGDARVRVLRGAELPAGWFGKPWACLQGARAATGELLCFTDSDTRHQPALLEHAVGELVRGDADLLTLTTKQLCVSGWERLIMPQLWTPLAIRYHPSRVNANRRGRDIIANGQFILVRRDAYEAVRGHEAVKGEVAEDLRLGQVFQRAGRRVRLAFGEALIETRMYSNLRELIEGWSKNVYVGGRQSFPDEPLLRAVAPLLVAGWLAGWLLPFGGLVAWAFGAAGGTMAVASAAAIALSLLFWLVIYWGMQIPRRWALGYPLGALLTLYIVARSTLRGSRRIEWRGRVYTAGAAGGAAPSIEISKGTA